MLTKAFNQIMKTAFKSNKPILRLDKNFKNHCFGFYYINKNSIFLYIFHVQKPICYNFIISIDRLYDIFLLYFSPYLYIIGTFIIPV